MKNLAVQVFFRKLLRTGDGLARGAAHGNAPDLVGSALKDFGDLSVASCGFHIAMAR